ncbi:MAG: response regulator [Pseudobdellovibrionaceae bacterium]
MRKFWKDLSIAKKLYVVVGIMALLIATELFTLLFAMDTLSSIRSFIAGEGFWSKAQKNAIYSLNRYVSTKDPIQYTFFQEHLQVALGDRQARIELEKPHPDMEKVYQGFLKGQNHPEDIQRLISLIQRFATNQYVSQALLVWRDADIMFFELIDIAKDIHVMISTNKDTPERLQASLQKVDLLNTKLTALENQFSQVLGEGSRWMESLLMFILVCAVLTVETTGVVLTIAFSRTLNRSLSELNKASQEIGKGNFSAEVPVRSQDELGLLAEAINKMARDLKKSVGERVQAENASQFKTQFLANMSHEIRTPLGVILGLVEILKDPHIPWNERIKYTETIERTGQNLTRIINDILDMSKVESGHLEIEHSKFSLHDFISELQTMMRVRAERNQNELHFIKQGDVPQTIVTDRTRLRQILINLVNNALKFTHNGTVSLTYCKQGSHLVFQVSDTGTGIEHEKQSQLFQAFSQAETSSLDAEGTGLGLVISKRLAQALGGDVTLKESIPGEGSTFVATVIDEGVQEVTAEKSWQISSDSTSSASTEANQSAILQGKKVLVVEDVLDNQMLTKLYLARKGMKVQFANNGAEGVQKALSEYYDFILMDMQMPVMDGYTATRNLRESGYQKPIIALTAHAMKEDRERCLQAGCDDYLTKPLDSAVLHEALIRNLNQYEEKHGKRLSQEFQAPEASV